MFQTLKISRTIKIDFHLIDLASVEQVKTVTWKWMSFGSKRKIIFQMGNTSPGLSRAPSRAPKMTGEDTFFSVVLSTVVPSVVFDTFVASVDVEGKDVSSGGPVVVLMVVALVVVASAVVASRVVASGVVASAVVASAVVASGVVVIVVVVFFVVVGNVVVAVVVVDVGCTWM